MSSPRPPKDVTAPRPNAQTKWVCGYSRLGLGCAEGPDKKGSCCQLREVRAHPAIHAVCHEECSCKDSCELAKLRYHPALPSHTELGPCSPQRAAWFSRQTLAMNLGILTAGMLLLSMSLPQREEFFVPGGLAKVHAQILSNHLVADRCSLCHPNSHGDVPSSMNQDDLCTNCHKGHLPEASLRNPHDVPREYLVKLTAKANPFDEVNGEHTVSHTSCAMCHIEHRGATFDLTAVSNTSCQACHQRRFESLAAGHPTFEGFPYRTQRRIAFDHAAHEQKHFGTKSETFECGRCHFEGVGREKLGPIIRTVGFEQACSRCHAQAIEAATINGWAFLQLPSIEFADSENSQLGLSQWPAAARFGYEGQIDVPLRLLLAADPEMRDVLAQIPATGQLQQITTDADQRGSVARSLARGLRRLIREFAADGQAAWQRRLIATASQRFGRELTGAELKLVDTMIQGVPPDLFRQMEDSWFGDSPSGVARKSDPSQTQPSPLLMVSQTNNYDALLSDSSDDSLLSDGIEDALLYGAPADDDTLLNGNAVSRGSAESKLTALRGTQHVAAGGWFLDHELLALRYMPRGHADPTLAAWAEFIALLDASPTRSTEPTDPMQPVQGVPLHMAATGGSSQLTDGAAIPGGCSLCHLLPFENYSLESPIENSSNWTSLARTSNIRPFTKFDHSPHLTLPTLSDCRYCHQLNNQHKSCLQAVIAENINSTAASSSRQKWTGAACQFLRDEFIDMRVEQCSACHQAGGASDGCTVCHNYHVGASGMNWSK
ncbi:MAG: hypothetical protein ABI557_02965 [Aureliella sp.]